MYRYYLELRRSVALLATTLVVGLYLVSCTLFFHSHCIDGVWIIHSHLDLTESGVESHTHSSEQLTLIDLFTASLIGSITLIILLEAFTILRRALYIYAESLVEGRIVGAAGRSPPQFAI